jgi:hypothetical protein
MSDILRLTSSATSVQRECGALRERVFDLLASVVGAVRFSDNGDDLMAFAAPWVSWHGNKQIYKCNDKRSDVAEHQSRNFSSC